MIGNTVRYDGISRLLSAMAPVMHYLRILEATWSPCLLVAGYGGLSLGRLLVVAPSCPPILGPCGSKGICAISLGKFETRITLC
jgi:hypothetical protein